MAPPSSRPKPSSPQLQITFPRNLAHAHAGRKVVFPLTVEDFQLSWLDFIKKHDSALWQVLAKQVRLTIMDIRPTSTRKVWRLNSTVKQFIDSFGRILQSYKAVIGTQPPNTAAAAQVSSASMPNGSGSNSNRNSINNGATGRASHSTSPSTKKGSIPVQDLRKNTLPCHTPTNTRSSSRNKPEDSAKAGRSPPSPLKRKTNDVVLPDAPPKRPNMNSGEFCLQMAATSAGPSNGTLAGGIPRVQFNFQAVDVDDSASMAPTVDSQDSQDDLREAGVRIEEVKTDIVKRLVSQFDNNMMLRMRLELQGLVKTQKYFSALKRLPYTSSMLQYIFRLNELN